MIRVNVKLIGFLSSFSKNQPITLKLDPDGGPTILSCLISLNKMFGDIFANSILDNRSGEPKTLILKNDVEIGALQKLETRIEDGDTVTILPFTHGG